MDVKGFAYIEDRELTIWACEREARAEFTLDEVRIPNTFPTSDKIKAMAEKFIELVPPRIKVMYEADQSELELFAYGYVIGYFSEISLEEVDA